MSNPNCKVTLRLSSKRKLTRVYEPLDFGSPTPFGFNIKKKDVFEVHTVVIAFNFSKNKTFFRSKQN